MVVLFGIKQSELAKVYGALAESELSVREWVEAVFNKGLRSFGWEGGEIKLIPSIKRGGEEVEVKEEKRGRPSLLDPEKEEFIRKNWQTMSDGDMARVFGVRGGTIAVWRRQLHIKRPRGGRQGVLSADDTGWLRQALLVGGLTEADVAKDKKVSRARVSQITDDFGIKIEQRTPQWFANRWGKPELADKEYFVSQLANGGFSTFSARTGLTLFKLKAQAVRLGIDPEQFKSYGRKV